MASLQTYIGVDLEGAIVNDATQAVPPITPPALPQFSSDAGNHYVQVWNDCDDGSARV